MKAIQEENTTKKKNGPTDKTSRLNQRRMTIMESVAAKQKKAEFTNLEKEFKKKFQSLSKIFYLITLKTITLHKLSLVNCKLYFQLFLKKFFWRPKSEYRLLRTKH